jgi:ankyrin repeat protein
MLERGAKRSTKFTNLRAALQSFDPKIITTFLMLHDEIDLSRNSPNYARECLAWALRVSQDHIVWQLIKMKTNIREKYIGGKSFLHIALEANHSGNGPSIDSIELLLNHMTHPADQTPLDSFVEVPSDGLAAGGAWVRAHPSIDVNAIDEHGENALCGLLEGSFQDMEAAEDKYCEILSLLIEKGINVNCQDSYGRQTLLHKAVKNGLYNIVQILLNKGADLNIKNKSGQTPVMLLFDCQHHDTTPQVQANLVNMLNILIAHGADINGNRGKNLFPLLMFAVVYDMDDVVRFMLTQYDVKIDETDEEGRTALHYACMCVNTSMVTLLLNAGANKKALDNDGEEPLSESTMQEFLDNDEVEKLEDMKAQFAIVHPTRAEIVGRLFLENRDSIKRAHDAMITLLNLRLDQNGMRHPHTPHNRRSEEYEYSEEYPYHEGDQEEDDNYAFPIMSRYPRFL